MTAEIATGGAGSMTAPEPRYRCAFCLRGMDGWWWGRKAPLCARCGDCSGAVRNPLEWEIDAARTSDAARRYWEHWAAPREPDDLDPPLTHYFGCWRFPEHHRCAVALIERQAEENTRLIGEAGALKRRIRDLQKP